MTPETPRSTGADGPACPDPNELAEYVDHVLPDAPRAAIERHLLDCASCRDAAVEAARFREHERFDAVRGREDAVSVNTVRPFRGRWVTAATATLAAAAAVVLIVRMTAGDRARDAAIADLVAAVSSAPTRPVVGRLTGGFAYAPAPSATRGAVPDAPASVRIAAAALEEKVGQGDTADARAAVGIAHLAVGDLDRAIPALEEAVSREPQQAAFSSDLAAGYLGRWQRDGREEDLRRAIDAADRALRANPNLLEARFNRALALAALPQADRSGLTDYLAHDSTGPWADEARARLAQLQASVPAKSS